MSAVESSNRIQGAAFEAAGRPARPVDKTFLRRVLMIGGVTVVAAASAFFYLTGGRYVGSDDSYVHGNKLMVSTDVSGLIKSVNVKEGQQVKKGDILFTLDPQPFQIAQQLVLLHLVLDGEVEVGHADQLLEVRRDREPLIVGRAGEGQEVDHPDEDAVRTAEDS